MSLAWTWKFFDALVANENGLVDVIKEVNYTLRGVYGEDDEARFYEIGGRTSLRTPVNADFKPFAGLTKTDLIAFVSNAVDVERLKAQLNAWHEAEDNIKRLPFEAI